MRMTPLLLTATLLATVGHTASTSCTGRAIADAPAFVKTKFDYLVIGGGTAGTTVSSRLAEDLNLIVGVIEAGLFHKDDRIVDVPAFSGVGNATYDWNFVTTPQEFAGDRKLAIPRGKMLGGSSGINGMAWGRASSVEYDSWTAFAGNPTWSWTGLLPFMRKSEHLVQNPPNPYPGISPAAAAQAEVDTQRTSGFTGPITASYNAQYFDVVDAIVETMNHQDIKTNAEPLAGNATGVYNTLASVDRAAGVRSYATSYYCAHEDNTNYHVLVGAQVTKIIFSASEKGAGGVIATGVEFVSGGQHFVAHVTKEVIISAGAVQTPQLLELSGIGNTSILSDQNITTLVDLPGVGENLQEHLYAGVQWKLKQGVQTFDLLRNNATFAAEQAAQYAKNRTGLLTDLDSTVAFLPLQDFVSERRKKTLLHLLDAESRSDSVAPLQSRQLQHQREWFSQGNVAAVELIQWSRGFINPEPGESYVVILGGIVHPTSRGSVHISSGNPLTAPAINPSFLNREFDMQVLLDVVKFAQGLGRAKPFSDYVAVLTNPDPGAQTDEELISYIRGEAAGGDHLVGTAAMADREEGGVVDAFLKVYGTANVRVVDASIFPIHIACHTQATVYAIAEKIADMIKNDGKF